MIDLLSVGCLFPEELFFEKSHSSIWNQLSKKSDKSMSLLFSGQTTVWLKQFYEKYLFLLAGESVKKYADALWSNFGERKFDICHWDDYCSLLNYMPLRDLVDNTNLERGLVHWFDFFNKYLTEDDSSERYLNLYQWGVCLYQKRYVSLTWLEELKEKLLSHHLMFGDVVEKNTYLNETEIVFYEPAVKSEFREKFKDVGEGFYKFILKKDEFDLLGLDDQFVRPMVLSNNCELPAAIMASAIKNNNGKSLSLIFNYIERFKFVTLHIIFDLLDDINKREGADSVIYVRFKNFENIIDGIEFLLPETQKRVLFWMRQFMGNWKSQTDAVLLGDRCIALDKQLAGKNEEFELVRAQFSEFKEDQEKLFCQQGNEKNKLHDLITKLEGNQKVFLQQKADNEEQLGVLKTENEKLYSDVSFLKLDVSKREKAIKGNYSATSD